MHIQHALRPPAPFLSTAMAAKSLFPCAPVNGHHTQHSTRGQPLSSVVAKPYTSLLWDVLPPNLVDHDSHTRCITLWLGCSHWRSHDTRHLDHVRGQVHINILELQAVHKVCHVFLPGIHYYHVLVMSTPPRYITSTNQGA